MVTKKEVEQLIDKMKGDLLRDIPRAKLKKEAERKRYNIVRNLALWGITDIPIQRVLHLLTEKGENKGSNLIQLSEACSEYQIAMDEMQSQEILVDPNISIHEGCEKIGYVDQDGCFHYTAAPNLRAAIGWGLATSKTGQHRVLDSMDVDAFIEVVREQPKKGAHGMLEVRFLQNFEFSLHVEFSDLFAKLANK